MSHRWRKPAPPPEVAQLRHVRSVIDPAQTYRMQMPDGRIYQATGAELIETAEASLELVDAMESGDRLRQLAALKRYEADLERG